MPRPRPTPSELTAPFWAAARERRLVRPRCNSCGRSFFTPQVACPVCLSEDWSYVDSAGRGTVYSFTVVHRAPSPALSAPYVLAVVELIDEGWSMLTNVVVLRSGRRPHRSSCRSDVGRPRRRVRVPRLCTRLMAFERVAIAGVFATRQARQLDSSSTSICLEAARGVIAATGIAKEEVDGIGARWFGPGGTVFDAGSADWATLLGIRIRWMDDTYPYGVPAVLNAAMAIEAGLATTVLILSGQAGVLRSDRMAGRLAAYTRPANEFVEPWGAFTLAHFILAANRYEHRFRTDHAKLALAAATVRNHGHMNPEAVMHGRGPYTADDVLEAPMVASPFTLLECCLANEGAAAILVTTRERARDCPTTPVRILGGGADWARQQYVEPVRYDDSGRVGEDAARRTFAMAGLEPTDVDVVELYDVTSFEIVRTLEICGFCGEGEGPDFVAEVGIGLDGSMPVNTDGGLMSFSHCGWGASTLRVVEAVRQLRGECGERQVAGAEVALVTGGGSGAQYTNVMLLGRDL